MADVLARLLSLFRLAGYFFICPKGFRAIRKVRQEKLTYLKIPALTDLVEVVISINKRGIQGDFIEAGCALGGSALVIAAVKEPTQAFYIHDTFELITSSELAGWRRCSSPVSNDHFRSGTRDQRGTILWVFTQPL